MTFFKKIKSLLLFYKAFSKYSSEQLKDLMIAASAYPENHIIVSFRPDQSYNVSYKYQFTGESINACAVTKEIAHHLLEKCADEIRTKINN